MKTTRPIFPMSLASFITERLLVRPYLPSDAEDMFILRSQPEVMKWTSSKVPDADIAKTREWIASALPPIKGDTFRFAIEERSQPGRVIGVIGIFFADPPECGYMFRTDMWGKGLRYRGSESLVGGLLGLTEEGGHVGRQGRWGAWNGDRELTG
jgi:RimJ/RimL family protein N-acetyltransferase